MIPNRIHFSISFPKLPHPVEDIWETIVSILKANRCLPRKFSLSQIAGHPAEIQAERDFVLTPEEIGQVIVNRQLNGFRVDTGYSQRSANIWLMNRYMARQKGV